MANLLGLLGYAGSGKDTAYEIIRKHRPDYVRFAFADKLKEFCSVAFDLPINHFHDVDKKNVPHQYSASTKMMSDFFDSCYKVMGMSDEGEMNVLYEEMFGIFLTEEDIPKYTIGDLTPYTTLKFDITPRQMAQYIGTDLFRKHHKDTVWLDFINSSKNTVVTDVRFENEAIEIKRRGGMLVRIEPMLDNKIMAHESESYINTIDYDTMIVNNGTSMEEFEKDVLMVFDALMESK
ncbi:MAG: hypothetical protein PF440_07885 [Thiomicrorhabdus sp.]|nr:hypothetical protein [Thiomicrorhabdus sp.]